MLVSKDTASGECALNLKTKFIITSVLLLLALGCTALAARAAVGAFQNFQQQDSLAKRGDIRTIRPWMTIPYVARVYQVPESYLYRSLDIPASRSLHHTTLHGLSLRYQRPVNDLIYSLQRAILAYRKHHVQPIVASYVKLKHPGKKPVKEGKRI